MNCNRNFRLLFIIFLILVLNNILIDVDARPRIKKEILKEEILAPGVIYRHFKVRNGRYRHLVHVVESDLVNPFIGIAVLKAKNQVNELEKLHRIITNWDTLHPHLKILSTINANFWRAYSNRPIGPTIIDGEILEMQTHKKWSSAFFDKISFMYIDSFFLSGDILYKQKKFNIDRANRRSDSLQIVFYNKYAGRIIPYISSRTLKEALNEEMLDKNFDDSTEIDFDTTSFFNDIRERELQNNGENKLSKIAVKYIDKPTINKKFRCIIEKIINTGSIEIPYQGAVISLAYNFNFHQFKIGDTLSIFFKTNVYDTIEFYNAISGTPRLVKQGIANHQAREEGSRGRRFINWKLPRTAIGTNKLKNKIYFAVVEPSHRSQGTRGTNLRDLSYIMKSIGCYDAMNLDGGGSSALIINDKNVVRSNPKTSRKLSVGLSIYLQKIGEMK